MHLKKKNKVLSNVDPILRFLYISNTCQITHRLLKLYIIYEFLLQYLVI